MIDYKSFDTDLVKIESKYSYKSDEIYYFNVHRTKELILKLQKRIEAFNQNLVPEIFRYALKEKIVTQEVSKFFGTGHIIVFVKTQTGKKLVLRTNLFLTEPEHYMDLEKDLSEMYSKVGIPSTSILFSDTTREKFLFDYQIMEYLGGKDLEQEWTGTKDEYDKISYQMGINSAKLYQLPLNGFGRLNKDLKGEIFGAKSSHIEYMNSYVEHDLEILKLFKFVNEKSIEVLKDFFFGNDMKSLFEDSKQGYLLLHDPSDHNMRYKGDKIVAVFDWENAVSYDPICEIGSAPTWKTHYPRKEQMTRGFIDTLGFKPANLKQKASVHFLRKIIDKAQFALKGERLSQRHIDLFNQACLENHLNITSEIVI